MIKFTKAEWLKFRETTEKSVHQVVEKSRGVKNADTRSRIGLREADKYDNEVDRVISEAQIRTLKSMSNDEIAFDGYKTIMRQAWKDNQDKETGLSVEPFGVVDLRVAEHLIELQERGDVSLWKWLESQVEKYSAGLVDLKDAEAFKNYELFVVE